VGVRVFPGVLGGVAGHPQLADIPQL